jgi:CheY-like chemotaxis protein
MGGTIEVESKEGAGSIFRFTVIFGYKSENISQRISDQKNPNDPAISLLPEELRHLRILLAEDNTVNQRITVRILEKLGWKATVVNNGQEVLNILNQQSFDVILMDDSMPLLNGIEATRVIRQEENRTGHHVPVIAMTANAMTGDREKYLASGMDGYVSKPIDRHLLYEEIVNLVTQRLKG